MSDEDKSNSDLTIQLANLMRNSENIGSGFGARQTTTIPGRFSRSGAPSSRPKIDRSKLQCSHCGKKKHTREMCFELVGYPDWWEDNHKPLIAKGKAAIGKSDEEGISGVLSPSSKPSEVAFGGTARVASSNAGKHLDDGGRRSRGGGGGGGIIDAVVDWRCGGSNAVPIAGGGQSSNGGRRIDGSRRGDGGGSVDASRIGGRNDEGEALRAVGLGVVANTNDGKLVHGGSADVSRGGGGQTAARASPASIVREGVAALKEGYQDRGDYWTWH